ncbi:MAG: hypothetical protein E3K32_10080 [wastewater metagenome]|nr:hypothetical protein [Candidatus Loosdrechtia aerotolerans]
MSEEKNTTEGQPAKKSASRQKSPGKRPKKEEQKTETQMKPAAESALPLTRKIDEIINEIESKPLKSLEKGERDKLLQLYERLILKMVREINSSRR